MEEDALERQLRAINERFEDIERQSERGRETVIVLLGSHSTAYGLAGWAAPHRLRTCVAQRRAGAAAPSAAPAPPRLEGLEAVRRALVARGVLKEQSKAARGEERRVSFGRAAQLANGEFGEIVVGAAMAGDAYEVRFPLLGGVLNARGEYGDERALSDLCAIIEHIFAQRLAAAASERDLILAAPEQLGRLATERLLELVMDRLRPRAVLLHQESALAFFGRNCAVGALLDLGHTKSTFACVEEGLVQREASAQGEFCGRAVRDLWRALLLAKRGLDLAPYDFGRLEDLIWENCAVWSTNAAPHSAAPPATYRVELEGVAGGEPVEVVLHTEDFVLALHSLFEEGETAPLDRAFVEWLEGQVPEALRAKAAANVVLTGGLCAIPGFAAVLEQRLAACEKTVAEIGFASENRELAGGEAAFLGATVLPKLDCFADIVVSPEQFAAAREESQRTLGGDENYLREKLFFSV